MIPQFRGGGTYLGCFRNSGACLRTVGKPYMAYDVSIILCIIITPIAFIFVVLFVFAWLFRRRVFARNEEDVEVTKANFAGGTLAAIACTSQPALALILQPIFRLNHALSYPPPSPFLTDDFDELSSSPRFERFNDHIAFSLTNGHKRRRSLITMQFVDEVQRCVFAHYSSSI